ncbi:hypothetical protein GCM10023084_04620 [Streptomyces lacrimifluminis]|uniref:Uncharacterized protein n=1 Tax=Streptomyces lacrimifluminis TaxID=1500077 RepID=A0A917NSZ7_9ACTN|nr:hypothetical protein GCM10012282_18360 [Streptomyces lacrimifluminis]
MSIIPHGGNPLPVDPDFLRVIRAEIIRILPPAITVDLPQAHERHAVAARAQMFHPARRSRTGPVQGHRRAAGAAPGYVREQPWAAEAVPLP